MSKLEKRMPSIIKRLDSAREALLELADIQGRGETQAAGDCRVKLAGDLREYADYLENATFWKNG